MFSTYSRFFLASIMVLSLFTPFMIQAPDVNGYSNKYLFDEAVDIFFDTDARAGDLDPVNTRDVFRIRDLQGDDIKYEKSQRLALSLKRDSGANVKGVFYEPNGRPIATLYSDGGWSDVEFFVPYDGDYFMEISTDPVGSSSGYTFQMGGEKDIVNSKNDGINWPGSAGISGSLALGTNLNPIHDPVDYYQFDVQPFRAVRAYLITSNPSTFEVLNTTQDLIGIYGEGDVFELRNDGGQEIRIFFRIYFPLQGGAQYLSSNSPSYTLNVTEWSQTTIPIENISAPWAETIIINEDEELQPPLNLSSHFIEEGGDRVEFQITSKNVNIDVKFVNFSIGKGTKKVQFTHARIIPSENWYGEEIVSFKASDLDGSVSDSIRISVKEVDDLPFISKIGNSEYNGEIFNMYADEDTVKVYKMIYGDDDDPYESLSFATNASQALMPFFELFQNGTMVLSPVQDDVGSYFFNVSLSDGRGGLEIVNIALSIEPVNDQPEAGIIEIVKGNQTLFPSEEITLQASGFTDIDLDPLSYEWDWGDGKTSTGMVASHVYATSHSGNTTVVLTVSDGKLVVKKNITILVEAPEDIAIGELLSDIRDPVSDPVKTQEEWKLKGSGDRVFTVSTVAQSGLDILSIKTQRRGNAIQVLLEIKDTIQIDGSFQYHLYMMKSGYQEPFIDFKNISSWDEIPYRLPENDMMIANRSYIGDPSIYVNSTGRILNKATLVWEIPFSELAEGGLSYPIDPEDFEIFCVSIHHLDYAEIKGLAERYIITDTAGEGALSVATIEPLGNASGSSSSSFGDFAKPTNILVIVGIILVLAIFGITGFILVQKQRKEKKEQEREFLDHIETMKKQGKDPFGKDLEEEEASPKVSYEELYGGPKPEGHNEKGVSAPLTSLPGPGLGGPVESVSHVEELKITGDDTSNQ